FFVLHSFPTRRSSDLFFKYVFTAGGIPEYLHGFLDHIRAPLQFSGKGKLTSVLEEGDYLPGHEDWQVIETKGHAQSHLSFFRERSEEHTSELQSRFDL